MNYEVRRLILDSRKDKPKNFKIDPNHIIGNNLTFIFSLKENENPKKVERLCKRVCNYLEKKYKYIHTDLVKESSMTISRINKELVLVVRIELNINN